MMNPAEIVDQKLAEVFGKDITEWLIEKKLTEACQESDLEDILSAA